MLCAIGAIVVFSAGVLIGAASVIFLAFWGGKPISVSPEDIADDIRNTRQST